MESVGKMSVNVGNIHEYVMHGALYMGIGAYDLSQILDTDWPSVDRLLHEGSRDVLKEGTPAYELAEQFAKLYLDMSVYVDITPAQASEWVRFHIPPLEGIPVYIMKERDGIQRLRAYLTNVKDNL